MAAVLLKQVGENSPERVPGQGFRSGPRDAPFRPGRCAGERSRSGHLSLVCGHNLFGGDCPLLGISAGWEGDDSLGGEPPSHASAFDPAEMLDKADQRPARGSTGVRSWSLDNPVACASMPCGYMPGNQGAVRGRRPRRGRASEERGPVPLLRECSVGARPAARPDVILVVSGVITALALSWIKLYMGVNPRAPGKLLTHLRREGADTTSRGRRGS